MPPARPVTRCSTLADSDLRAIGVLALLIVLAATVAFVIGTRTLAAPGAAGREGEVIGATLALAGAEQVVVNSVRADGPAMRGGLRVGDLIERVDGRSVLSVDAAGRALLNRRVDIRVRRGKKELDLHLDATGGARLGQQDPADRG